MHVINIITDRLIEWGNRCPNEDRVYITVARYDNLEHDILHAPFIKQFKYEFVDIGGKNFIGIWFVKRTPEYVEFQEQ